MTKLKHPTNRYERMKVAEKKKRQRTPTIQKEADHGVENLGRVHLEV